MRSIFHTQHVTSTQKLCCCSWGSATVQHSSFFSTNNGQPSICSMQQTLHGYIRKCERRIFLFSADGLVRSGIMFYRRTLVRPVFQCPVLSMRRLGDVEWTWSNLGIPTPDKIKKIINIHIIFMWRQSYNRNIF